MSEEDIKELLNRLFCAKYKSRNYSWDADVISKDHHEIIENIVRQFLLEHHDSEIGELKAKVTVYEAIIKNSNFAPMIAKEQESKE